MPEFFQPQIEAGYYSFNTTTGVPSGTLIRVLPANPNRVAFIFSPSVTQLQALSIFPTVTLKAPLFYGDTNAPVIAKWEDIGAIVTLEWYTWQTIIAGRYAAVPLNLWQMTEIIYTPPR